jgi:hypothetical protein
MLDNWEIEFEMLNEYCSTYGLEWSLHNSRFLVSDRNVSGFTYSYDSSGMAPTFYRVKKAVDYFKQRHTKHILIQKLQNTGVE